MNTEHDDDDLVGLPRWPRWILQSVQLLFGVPLVIGFLTFFVFMIYFFIVFRSGAAEPGGERVVPLRDHAEVVYITEAQHELIEFLKFVGVGGLVIGMPGYFAVRAAARGLRRRQERAHPVTSHPGIIVAPPRQIHQGTDTIKP